MIGLRKDGGFLASLLLLTAFLGISIPATSACNEQKQTLNIKGVNNMTFRFEDYDVKSPEIVQSKLVQLFPKGSSSIEFKNVMERSGASCEGNNPIYCRHQSGKNPFVKSKWIVKVKIGNDSCIDELTVSAGLVGT
jgi:hypothetical protein